MSRLRQHQPLSGRAVGGFLTMTLTAGVGLVAVPSAGAETPPTAVRTAGAAAPVKAPQRIGGVAADGHWSPVTGHRQWPGFRQRFRFPG